MLTYYDIKKIKYSVGQDEFNKAVALYEGGKVTNLKEDEIGCGAVVLGTKPYKVYVHKKTFERGMCECYLGERDILCKHMIALAIYMVLDGKNVAEDVKNDTDEMICSNKKSEISKEEITIIKKEINEAVKCIKYYIGSSKTWFAYQGSLDEGCHRLNDVFSRLSVSKQTAKIVVDTLIRVDKKLLNGVDDSNGTVGNFIVDAVNLLIGFVKLDSSCKVICEKLRGVETSFGWEENLFVEIDKIKND